MHVRYLSTGLVALLLGVSLAIGNTTPTNDEPDDAAEAEEGKLVYVIPVEGLISDVMLTSMQRRTEVAEEAGADLIVYEIDTYGGLVTSALEIGTFIKNLPIETLVWVNDKAISAGAMIAVAADGIVMAERSRIGDAAPIAIGQQLDEVERAKIESPILEEFRDSARRNNYPLALSEAMVVLSPAIYQIENVDTGETAFVYATELPRYDLEPLREEHIRPAPRPHSAPDREDSPTSPFGRSIGLSGVPALAEVDAEAAEAQPTDADTEAEPADAAAEDIQTEDAPDPAGDWQIVQLVNPANTLVTLSQDEAIEYGFATQIVADDDAMMALTGATAETYHRLDITWSESLANLLVSPGVRAVLMILLLLGAYMELQSPGLGLPGAVAVTALLLMVGAPFIAGLADMTEILMIAFGLILIAVELFLLPGLGIAGITGVLLVLAGFLMTFVPPDPEPGWVPTLDATWDGLRQGLGVLMVAILVTGVAGYFIARNIDRVPLFRRLVLEGTVDSASLRPSPAGGPTGAEAADESAPPETAPAAAPPAPAVREGVEGRAITGLRPAGRVEVDGQLVDVVTAGRWVEAGEAVRIIEIRGNRIVVEQA